MRFESEIRATLQYPGSCDLHFYVNVGGSWEPGRVEKKTNKLTFCWVLLSVLQGRVINRVIIILVTVNSVFMSEITVQT